MEFYASCPEGFEDALADELRKLGLGHIRKLKGRATFEGTMLDAYRACMFSRLASRVFTVLERFEAANSDALYEATYNIAWEDILNPGASFSVSARGVTDELRNTHFSSLRVKDAICDRLVDETGKRPDFYIH